jgi:hypothetical protein
MNVTTEFADVQVSKNSGTNGNCNYFSYFYWTASVVYWSEILATDTEVLGSIPGASRFSEKQRIWN